MDKNFGEQAKRPMDKNFGEQAKRPMDKNFGEQAKRPMDKNFGEQAKRPMDKKLAPCWEHNAKPGSRLHPHEKMHFNPANACSAWQVSRPQPRSAVEIQVARMNTLQASTSWAKV
jgi:hypothetical protein